MPATEVPGSTPKGVIQWTESGGAQIVQTSDGRVIVEYSCEAGKFENRFTHENPLSHQANE